MDIIIDLDSLMLMTPQLPDDFLPRVRQILLPLVSNQDEREALITEAFYCHDPLIYRIKREGAPYPFCVMFIKSLLDFGCLQNGQHAVSRLLATSKYSVGGDKHHEIDTLIEIADAQCESIDEEVLENKVSELRVITPITTAPISISTPLDDRTPTVFISYSHRDTEIAERLIADLNKAGHACWIDTVRIKGGDEWVKSITEGINNSYAFLSLVSQSANDSTWVRREFLWAEYKKKRIFPLMVKDCELTIYLMERQVLDLHSSYETGLGQLLAVLPTPTTPDALTAKPVVNRRRLELDYLDKLSADVLFDLEKYTPLGGESQFLVQVQKGQSLELALMKPEFEHLQQTTEHHSETRTFTNAVDEILQIKRAVLLGEPGGGKTTTLLSLAGQLANEAHENPDAPIPLFVHLGRWTKADQSLFDFIVQEIGKLGEHLQTLFDEGRAVPLLDGMNEIPVSQREAKYKQIQQFIGQYPDWMAVASCREQDYVIDLKLDRITVTPLDPLRIREFVVRYLGEANGIKLFWRIAGEHADMFEARFKEKFADQLDNWEAVFWTNANLPFDLKWKGDADLSTMFYYGWDNWLKVRNDRGSLLRLSQNPYMLAMLTQVFVALGELPVNRGGLFNEFIQTLLVREKLATRNPDKTLNLTNTALQLVEGLEHIAYEMQVQQSKENYGDAVTVLEMDIVDDYLSDNLLYWAGSTSILSIDGDVRFTHQLLQEYFAAMAINSRVFGNYRDGRAYTTGIPMQASEIWTSDNWWKRTNWEEVVILLAGLYRDDCSKVVRWVNQANPEVAALCVVNSGADLAITTQQELQIEWLQRLTDIVKEPNAHSRAAVGRALGLTNWDNRIGVNVMIKNGVKLPDIDWVTIPDDGEWTYQDYKHPALPEFRISRYPITYVQFQSFIEDKEGFYDPRWWEGLGIPDGHNDIPANQGFEYWNHPRERVSWYDAIAFCRWLSWRLGGDYSLDEVGRWLARLPTEFEWEKAARGTEGLMYPFENLFSADKANTRETRLNQTSAVGLFPQGASPYGVLDMSGNVWDWCLLDRSNPQFDSVVGDLSTSLSCVLCGGSWVQGYYGVSTLYRDYDPPYYRSRNVGFRICTSL